MIWKKSQPAAPVAPKPKAKWHAVSVSSEAGSCFPARLLKGQRFLSTEAPLLPLADCTQPASCSCTYKKFDDRRAGLRRSHEISGIRRPSPEHEQRTTRGRRKRDLEK
jgi:hypothetical protein